MEIIDRNASALPPNMEILEEQIYSFFKTGMTELNPMHHKLAAIYKEETFREVNNDIQIALIMMIISVCSIFIIILAVVPNFSKIEQRKYQVLSFFFVLPSDLVKECIDRSDMFED